MTVDCAHEPLAIVLLKTAGPALAIAAAVVAWIGNNIVSWVGWHIGRSIRCYETMRALNAEIASNGRSERSYADPGAAETLINQLKKDPGPFGPWEPYVAVVERNIVFENAATALTLLPAVVAEKTVSYYNLTAGLTLQIKDFRSDAFRSLSRRRQETVIRNLFVLGESVSVASRDAQQTIGLRLTRYQLSLGLLVSGGLATVLVGIPELALAVQALAEFFRPAAEWVSTCDPLSKR